MCKEELTWKFTPSSINNGEPFTITITFTSKSGETFAVDTTLEIKEADVLGTVGFSADMKIYNDEACTSRAEKVNLGAKFYAKIVLTDLVFDTNSIACDTFVVKQVKDGVETVTDLKSDAEYQFVEIAQSGNNHICGAELDSPHFHTSAEGYESVLESEIVITYKQGEITKTLRRLLTYDLQ